MTSVERREGGDLAAQVAEVIRRVREYAVGSGWQDRPLRSGELELYVHRTLGGAVGGAGDDEVVEQWHLVLDTHYASGAGKIWVDVYNDGNRWREQVAVRGQQDADEALRMVRLLQESPWAQQGAE